MSVYSNWKYFFDSFWKFVSRNSYPIVLVLFFIWICIGIFPLTCYESDSMHVIAGCNIMYNQGLTFPPVYSYLYEMQPLVTYTVVGFKSIVCCLPYAGLYLSWKVWISFIGLHLLEKYLFCFLCFLFQSLLPFRCIPIRRFLRQCFLFAL